MLSRCSEGLGILFCCALLAAPINAAADAASPPPPKADHWLFVGNSLVQRHDVQNLVAEIARSLDGSTPRVDRSTLGGATLESHLERTDSEAPLPRIQSEDWGVVVLQPNGKLAMTERPHGLEPYALKPARTLVEAVRARGGRPILLMTWPYRGQESTLPGLRRNFATLGRELSVEVAPVGEAFVLAREQTPEISILDDDGIHASLPGAYLEAAVLFATIQRRSPVGADVPAGINGEQGRRLQELAWRVVNQGKQ